MGLPNFFLASTSTQLISSSFLHRRPSSKVKLATMAAVYKSLSKASGQKDDAPKEGIKRNKQRVLILSSRGVTFRYVLPLRIPCAVRSRLANNRTWQTPTPPQRPSLDDAALQEGCQVRL